MVEFAILDLSHGDRRAIFSLEIGVVCNDILLVKLLAQPYARYVDRSAVEVVLVVDLDIVVQVRIVFGFCRVLKCYQHGFFLLWHAPAQVQVIYLVVIAQHGGFDSPIVILIQRYGHLRIQAGDGIPVGVVQEDSRIIRTFLYAFCAPATADSIFRCVGIEVHRAYP